MNAPHGYPDACVPEGARFFIDAWTKDATPTRAARMLRLFAESADRSMSIESGRGRREAAALCQEAARLYREAADLLEALVEKGGA